MIEASIEKTVVALAERNGWLVRKVAWLGRRGAPDRLFAKDGRVVLIEFKSTGKAPRLNQIREIERLIAAGIDVEVCDSVDQACRTLGLPRG